MQASNLAAGDDDFRAGVPAVVDGIFAGSHGFTVRCTPHRRTVMAIGPDGEHLFAKLRLGGHGDAKAEWHWLHLLPMLGLQVPQPVALEQRGGTSLLCTAAAPGRPLDALLCEAIADGQRERAVAFVCRVVARRVRALHEHGLVFRDLYWNHLFAAALGDGDDVWFIDVERVFRPRWRRRRWIVKDLASLVASWPEVDGGGPRRAIRAMLQFLVAYLGERITDRRLRRGLLRAAVRKAQRIRAHEPRYG